VASARNTVRHGALVPLALVANETGSAVAALLNSVAFAVAGAFVGRLDHTAIIVNGAVVVLALGTLEAVIALAVTAVLANTVARAKVRAHDCGRGGKENKHERERTA
jgi:hypothetical protein